MRIKYTSTYKSLGSFESEQLEKLCIITGKNGSGKTQLVQLFKTKQAQHFPEFVIEPNAMKIQVEDLEVKNFSGVDYTIWKNTLSDKFGPVKNLGSGILDVLKILESKGIDLYSATPENVSEIVSEKNVPESTLVQLKSRFQSNHPTHLYRNLIYDFLLRQKRLIALLKYTAETLHKDLEDIGEDDLIRIDYPENLIDAGDLFANKIELVFYSYQKRRKQNLTAFVQKTEFKEENDSIPDPEFVKRYPSPVSLINTILEKYKSKYEFEEANIREFNENNRKELTLKNRTTGVHVNPVDLSSGEKVIIGLILKLFQTNYFNDLTFPDLIVLDEPDAYLHPEMSKLLIEVLYEIFVLQFGINVIFTTHSPSTIAVAPEDCIYELKNEPMTSLKKVSKNEALKILTENIPTLSIDYKNHKQVFVESPTDAYYYQGLFNRIKTDKKPVFNLYFISTGYGKSNCSQVIELTNSLRKAGNTTSYGILDWDAGNKPADNIYVHGFENKYSIENFIYNPLYLLILFIEEGCSNDVSELGFDKTYNQYDLVKEPEENLQKYIEWFFKKIQEKSSSYKYENPGANEFAGGKVIQIPKWYNHANGHKILEPLLKKTFPSLNNHKYDNEGKLQEVLTNIAIKCYPFIDKETSDLLMDLSNR
jgi:AAA15 family ATPase/GTPase